MRGRGMPLAGALALTSGAVGVAAALVSLLGPRDMMGAPMTGVSPLPAVLLLVFSGLVLLNGLLLVLGWQVAPGMQGGLMILYGVLMVLAGALMAGTPLFAMQGAPLSAAAMFGLGGLMVVSGSLMAAGRSMDGG